MDSTQITDVILDAIRNANLSRPSDEQLTVSPEAMLFGPGSPLDSMGLIALLIDIEEGLAAQGLRIRLSDDRAMSESRSPFRSVPRLAGFISTLLASA